jgi:signal peptidase
LATLVWSLVLVAIVVPIGALVVGAWVAGWHLSPLRTTSMEPAYRAGSLMVVAPARAGSIGVGSVIVFSDPEQSSLLVAHRVVEVQRDDTTGLRFRTKGDANLKADPYPVPAANLRGEVRWAVPGLGRAAWMLQWPTNAVVLVGIPAALLVATELQARRRARRSPRCELCGQPTTS